MAREDGKEKVVGKAGRKPAWLKRIPQICEELRALDSPYLDLPTFARIFGVRRRQALNLAHQMGLPPAQKRYRRAYVIERADLLTALSTKKLHRAVSVERLRLASLAEQLVEARRDVTARAVRIPLSPTARDATLATLPETIELRRDELRIAFKDAGDLLQQLFVLSRAIGRDFPTFERLLQDSGAPAGAPAQPGFGYQTGFTRGAARGPRQ